MKHKITILFVVLVILTGCNGNPWDEYTSLSGGVARQNLLELMKSRPELSSFTALVIQTGWDKELQNTRVFTVWAASTGRQLKPASPTAELMIGKCLR